MPTYGADGPPPPPARIRPTIPADLPALKALISTHALCPPDLLDRVTAASLAGAAPEDIWLTTESGGPVALAHCALEQRTQGTWNLLLVAVHPSRQGFGLGTALVRHVELLLAARGERLLLTETSALPVFARIRAFWRRLGFREEARIREFYAAGEDKIVFRKSLSRRTAGM